MVTELTKGIYWVGVVDWGLRHFHGHELSTHRGSTYNSYLIVDEKIAAGDLLRTLWQTNAGLVADIKIFDLYRGKPIPPGKKSLAEYDQHALTNGQRGKDFSDVVQQSRAH
jgi:hypothetical protein